MGALNLLTKDFKTCMVFVKKLLPESTVGMTTVVMFSWLLSELLLSELVVRTSPLLDKVVKGEQEAASFRVVELTVVSLSVAPR